MHTNTEMRRYKSSLFLVIVTAFVHLAPSAAHSQTVKLLRTLKSQTGGISSITFSPDGKNLLAGEFTGDPGDTPGVDGTKLQPGGLRLWDVRTGKLKWSRLGFSTGGGVTYSPDSRKIAVGSEGLLIQLRDARTGRVIHSFRHSNSLGQFKIAFSPDGKKIATADFDVRIWDTQRGVVLRKLTSRRLAVNSVGFSQNGKTLAASQAGSVKLWDALSFRLLHELEHDAQELAFSGDGNTLMTIASTVKLWNTGTGQLTNTLTMNDFQPSVGVISRDNRLLAIGGRITRRKYRADYTPPGVHDVMLASGVQIRDARTGAWRRTLKHGKESLTAIAISPNGRLIATSDWDTVKLWQVR